MKKPDEFIIIDDDEMVNLLCGIAIRLAFNKDTEVKTFTQPDDGVNYLKDGNKKTDFKTVVFLDTNMPITDGWEALRIIEKLDESIKKQLSVFMLSSSIDPNDKKRAMEHPLVLDFIEKPLTIAKIESIFKSDVNKQMD